MYHRSPRIYQTVIKGWLARNTTRDESKSRLGEKYRDKQQPIGISNGVVMSMVFQLLDSEVQNLNESNLLRHIDSIAEKNRRYNWLQHQIHISESDTPTSGRDGRNDVL